MAAGGAHGALRVVAVGDGSAEHAHDTIAATLCAFSTRKAVKAEMEKLQALVDAKRPK